MTADKKKNEALMTIGTNITSLVHTKVAQLTGTALAPEPTPERQAFSRFPRLSDTFAQMAPVSKDEKWLVLALPKSRLVSQAVGISAMTVILANLLPLLVTAGGQAIVDLLQTLVIAQGGAIPVLVTFALTRINYHKIFRQLEYRAKKLKKGKGYLSPQEEIAINSIRECLHHLEELSEQAHLLLQGLDDEAPNEETQARAQAIQAAEAALRPKVAQAMAAMEIQMQQGRPPEFDLGHELQALRQITDLNPTLPLNEYLATIKDILEVIRMTRKEVVDLLEEKIDSPEDASK
jgi:hypothetical protein